jgi:ATP-dependent Clp protease ATP-binding subunit ClpA/ActR/RegA family two-component response regulator
MSNSDSSRVNDMVRHLSARVIGQNEAFHQIVPFLEMHQAGLSPEGRPIGIFLLLGPTGTGKTRTVEVLAELLHGSYKSYLRVDCGEYQLDHEVARLVGAPPGYLGHRETKPVLSQEAVNSVTSPQCDISLVLFDEIEKAAPSLTKLLLGVLDKASLQMGDNTQVNFERSLIFLTSNLGAREMMREFRPGFGFDQRTQREEGELVTKLESIALAAVKKRFSPEFVNRIDCVVTYKPLSAEVIAKILDLQIEELREHVKAKLGPKKFGIEVDDEAKKFLLKTGTSVEYGARELKRTVYRHLTQPLATLVAQNRVPPGSRVAVTLDESGEKLSLSVPGVAIAEGLPSENPHVLIVDDNQDLLRFLGKVMEDSGWDISTAETAADAKNKAKARPVDVALLDYMLPDQNGLSLGIQLKERNPKTHVLIMTGTRVSVHEEEICRLKGFPLIQKPFLVEEILEPLRRRLRSQVAGGPGAS